VFVLKAAVTSARWWRSHSSFTDLEEGAIRQNRNIRNCNQEPLVSVHGPIDIDWVSGFSFFGNTASLCSELRGCNTIEYQVSFIILV
jgi:hypothetical protein